MSGNAAPWLRGPSRGGRFAGGSKVPGRTVGGSPAARSRAGSAQPAAGGMGDRVIGPKVLDKSGRISEYSSTDDKCPVCSSDRYLNPALRLLVSPCYHKMCESCIDRIFTLGPEPCPVCGQITRKTAFTAQTFEDLGIEKEVHVRKRIVKVFNKRREDFESLREYNDYLEMVEDITFNLIHNIDLPETESRIRAHQSANAASIQSNIQRDQTEAEAVAAEEARERREREARAAEARREEEREREEREREREAVLRELEHSDKAAARVIARSRAIALKRSSMRSSSSTSVPTGYVLPAQDVFPPTAPLPSALPETFEVLHDEKAWDDYTGLYSLREGERVYVDQRSEAVWGGEKLAWAGGWERRPVWERAVREAVAEWGLEALDGEGTGDREGMKGVEVAPAAG